MKTAYLLIDLFSILPTLILSFHPTLQLNKRWDKLWPAILLVAFAFILWDMYYTYLGVWGFNERYLLGLQLMNLPLEEVLFFICIPYACIFSYHCLNTLVAKDYFKIYEKKISIGLVVLTASLAFWHFPKLYTTFAMGGLALIIILLQFVVKSSWLSRFYFSYLILLVPFTIVNGILTGTCLDEPIVWYNSSQFMGYRFLTIPFEDIFYGMLMLICSVSIYEYLLSSTTKSLTHK